MSRRKYGKKAEEGRERKDKGKVRGHLSQQCFTKLKSKIKNMKMKKYVYGFSPFTQDHAINFLWENNHHQNEPQTLTVDLFFALGLPIKAPPFFDVTFLCALQIRKGSGKKPSTNVSKSSSVSKKKATIYG